LSEVGPPAGVLQTIVRSRTPRSASARRQSVGHACGGPKLWTRRVAPSGTSATRRGGCSKPEAPLSGSAGVNTQSAAARVEKPTCGLISTVDDNGGALRGGGRTMGDLAANLTGRMNQPVRDRTGLTGSYDFVLRWTPENFSNAATNAGPSRDGTPIVTALQEQLGLKLEAQRAPVEFLIIDRIERPSPD